MGYDNKEGCEKVNVELWCLGEIRDVPIDNRFKPHDDWPSLVSGARPSHRYSRVGLSAKICSESISE